MYIVSDFPRDLVLWPKNLSFGKNNLDEWLDKKVQCNKTRNGSARRLWAAFLIIWSQEIPSIIPEATVAQFHKSILTKTQYWKKTQYWGDAADTVGGNHVKCVTGVSCHQLYLYAFVFVFEPTVFLCIWTGWHSWWKHVNLSEVSRRY